MGGSISATAQPLQSRSCFEQGVESLPQVTVFTIGTVHDTWMDTCVSMLTKDGFQHLGHITLTDTYDYRDETTGRLIELVHADLENTDAIDQVHFTERASRYPMIGIFRSSRHVSAQFIQLDGEF